MTNNEIILQECLLSGLYTESQIAAYIEADKMPPIHTVQMWNQLGMAVKKGSHAAIKTRLWRKKKDKSKIVENEKPSENPEGNDGFYLANAFLFTADQVEPLKEDER